MHKHYEVKEKNYYEQNVMQKITYAYRKCDLFSHWN